MENLTQITVFFPKSGHFSPFLKKGRGILVFFTESSNSLNKSYFLFLAIIFQRFERKSIICSATLIWNHLQNKYSNHDFMKLASKALKNSKINILIS